MPRYALTALVLLAALCACGGGGGAGGGGTPPTSAPSSSSTSTPTSNPTTTPTSTPATTATVSGTVTDFLSNAAVANAVVTIGTLPNTNFCAGWSQCGSPIGTTYTATTSSTGTFSIANVPILANNTVGYFLEISKDANPTVSQTYTILHRTLPVESSSVNVGTVHITALTTMQQTWLAEENSHRANASLSIPTTGPIVVDEYAQEDAQMLADAEVADATNTAPCSNGGDCEAEFASQYVTNFTDPIGSAGATSAQTFSANAPYNDCCTDDGSNPSPMTAWWNEGAGCSPQPNNWETCTPYASAGHYINLSENNLVFWGAALSITPATGFGHGGFFAATIDVYSGVTSRSASLKQRTTYPFIPGVHRHA